MLERADEVGGTWRDNTYPGCACDVPSALYSFSFAPNPDWGRLYAGQPEIRAYARAVAREHGVTSTSDRRRGARRALGRRRAALADRDDARQLTARAVIAATGPWTSR